MRSRKWNLPASHCDNLQAPGGSQAQSTLGGAPDTSFKVGKINRPPYGLGGIQVGKEEAHDTQSPEIQEVENRTTAVACGEGEEPTLQLGLPRSGVWPHGCG